MDNKIYVGQHYQQTSAFDDYLGSGVKLQQAIKKYGKDKFVREVLDYCNSATVDQNEIYWIDKLSATNNDIGYNITTGGRGCLAGSNNPFNGKHHSEELKSKWRNSRKGTRLNKDNTFYGKSHTQKSKQLIGQSSKLRTKYIYFFVSPIGECFNNILNLQDFCNTQGWRQNNLKFINNQTKYKNWFIQRIDKESL